MAVPGQGTHSLLSAAVPEPSAAKNQPARCSAASACPGYREAVSFNVADACVPLYSAEDWDGGRVPATANAPSRSLVELVALDNRQRVFTVDDLDPETVRLETIKGLQHLSYALRPEHQSAYADWTEANLNRTCAVVYGGEVLTAPVILGRLPGRGVIAGKSLTHRLDDLALVMRTGALLAAPRLVREEPLR